MKLKLRIQQYHLNAKTQIILQQLNLTMEVFENCKWVHHKKSNTGPSKRWGHTAALLNNQMYIFGGKLDQQSRKFNQFVRITHFIVWNCPNCRNQEIVTTVSLCKGVYIFGEAALTKKQNLIITTKNKKWFLSFLKVMQVSSECFVFDGKDWAIVQQNGLIPQARESQISTILQNRYLLMYGGCRQQQIFNDFNVFDVKKRTWYPLKILGETFPILENASLTLINNQIYLFGGQSTLIPIQVSNGIMAGQSRQIYHNELYRLQLSSYQFNNQKSSPVLIVHKVKFYNKPPPERSTHCAIGYSDRYLIILGGQTYSKTNHENADLLNDVWCLDLHSSLWKQIKPAASHLFKKHSNFSAILCKQEIILFGGLKSVDDCTSYDELLCLKLFDLEQYKVKNVCGVCKLAYKNAFLSDENPQETFQHQQHSDIKGNKSNIRTVYKTAQMINHPFDAVKLLIQSSILTKSSRIHINLRQVQGRQILVFVDNSLRMDKSEYQWIISNTISLKPQPIFICEEPTHYNYTKSLVDYSKFLKYGGFKLGKGIFSSHINQKGEMVSVMTEDTVYYYFMEYHKNSKEYILQNKNQYLNDYQIITPLLNKIGQDDRKIKDYTSRKVIYNLHSQDSKNLHYLKYVPNDIELIKKSQYIINPNGESYIESLRYYISTLFVDPIALKISINNDQIIPFQAQSSIYDKDCFQKISDCNLQSQTGFQFYIYFSPSRLNNEIKIYRNNFLVTKSKRHQRGEYCGYIIVPHNWEPNLFQTGFENDPDFIYDAIDYVIRQDQLRKSEKETADMTQ